MEKLDYNKPFVKALLDFVAEYMEKHSMEITVLEMVQNLVIFTMTCVKRVAPVGTKMKAVKHIVLQEVLSIRISEKEETDEHK